MFYSCYRALFETINIMKVYPFVWNFYVYTVHTSYTQHARYLYMQNKFTAVYKGQELLSNETCTKLYIKSQTKKKTI